MSAEHPSVVQTVREMSRPVWLLLTGMLVNRLGNFLQIYLVLYLTDKGFAAYGAGLALGAYGVGSVAGVLAGGTVSDRFGYRWTIVASMAGAGALTTLIVVLPSLPLIVVVAAVVGALGQAYRPASSAMLVELTPERQHVMVFAVYRLAFNLGTTAGPLLGALLITYSYDLMFYVDAVTSVLFAVFALTLPHTVAGKDAAADGAGRGSYLGVLADRRFTLFMLALFLNAVVYIQHVSVLPLQVTADGNTPELYAALLSLNAVVVIALELPLTKFVQRMPAKLAVAVGVGLVGVGMNLYVAGPAVAMFVVATLVWTLGEIVGTPTVSAYPGQVAPPGMRGRYIAAAAMPMQIGYAAGPVIGVTLWTLWPDGVWWGSGVITVFAVVAALAGMTRPATAPAVTDGEPAVTESPIAEAPLDAGAPRAEEDLAASPGGR
ncbi:MFS transporter [Sphaerisporangium album]|uniref:MFS transporter n=1 Tax=Sphaerisporangium album TaxID=509200 RepID=A0A367FTX2_9ACTN|nr:MFS transporter [Sphaerisporangium album]RCG33160.1 MFS transporter [Sphaerisporangium album]